MTDAIVLYPSSGRGHLVSMVELGKLILAHYPSFFITIVISSSSFPAVSSYITEVTATNPSISFIQLPLISTPIDSSSPIDFPTLSFELVRLNNPNLHDALISISRSSNIKAFVIDFFCNSAFQISSGLNIPTYYFIPCSGSGLAAILHLPTIHKNTTGSLKDLDTLIHVPGIPPFPAYNMPQLMLDQTRKAYEHMIDTATQMKKSAGLIMNTFELLDQSVVKAIRNGEIESVPRPSMPPFYCIGPLIGTEAKKGGENDKDECLSWLDSQPSQSVVYLSFGSKGRFSAEQLKEMAVGLEKSGFRFLWVVRTPPQADQNLSLEAFLPEGFLDRTKGRGFVVKSWAPQIAILNHDSVGGFVTHCGWNSIIEAVCAGVPMLAWPLAAEQKVNRVFLVQGIKVALSVGDMESRDGFVSAAELEKGVSELMDSEKGRDLRERVTAMRDGAREALQEGGSSRVALAQLVDSLN